MGGHSLHGWLVRADGSALAGTDQFVGFTTLVGLVAAYSFDAEDGSSALDQSGAGNHASGPAGQCPAYLATGGRNGTGAYDFAGDGNYLEIANEGTFDFTTQFAVSFWMLSNGFAHPWEQLVGKGDSAWSIDRKHLRAAQAKADYRASFRNADSDEGDG